MMSLAVKLKNAFRNIEVPRNEGSRLNKGRAFIEFSSIEDAQEVYLLNG